MHVVTGLGMRSGSGVDRGGKHRQKTRSVETEQYLGIFTLNG